MDGEITALRLDGRGEDLFVGTSQGRVLRYDMRDRTSPAAMESVTVGTVSGTPVTALGFLLGDRTLVVGDSRGQVSTWQVVPPPQGGAPRLTRVYEFASHTGPVVAISPSKRDKGFVTADAAGQLHLRYGTSGETLVSPRAPGGDLRSVVFAPKTDGVVVVDGKGAWSQWQVDNPHPEITLKTVFGKVWYEGYTKPEYVWQSTGGTDDFEAKFSLTPLIYGTLKGTFYALLFAVPLALLAATYVSEFMHPTVKGYVKPVVEIMAALPSVVLGFLAGLWLAPMIERVVPGLFLLPFVLTVSILVAFAAWRTLPTAVRGHFKTGTEVFLLLPVVVLSAWIAFALGGLVEATLLGGSYRGWLLSALGLTYDQRNSLVVGVAMGFAVIPIIFTIAEDSLANVPQHLRAGSLALGRHTLADRAAHRPAHREPGYLLRHHDRFRTSGRRDHDRAHGHRKHPGHGLECLQRVPRALREHRGGAARGAGGRDALPRALPRRVPPLLSHLCREHRRRAGPTEAPAEVSVPVSGRLAKTWRGGEPFIWLTGGALALALLLVAGLIGLILVNGLGFFWPKDVVRVTLADGKILAGQLVGARTRAGKGGRVPDQAEGGESRSLRSRLPVGGRGTDHPPGVSAGDRRGRADRMGVAHRHAAGGA